jgi:hypothetical protein
MFPPTKSKAVIPETFEYTLKELVEVDLELRPTHDLEQHLAMDGNILFILRLGYDDNYKQCDTFQYNRVARCLSLTLYMSFLTNPYKGHLESKTLGKRSFRL